jgi:hypothetical protein
MLEDNEPIRQDEKIESLLGEFLEHRTAIRVLIGDLERIKLTIDRLIPDSLDARYVRFFEEKIKTITSLFTTLLEMRKEISKSVKDEIDIRRRFVSKGEQQDIEQVIDIRAMAKKIKEFEDIVCNEKEKRGIDNEDKKMDKSISVPGLNA